MNGRGDQADFIEVYPQVLDTQTCAAIVQRLRDNPAALVPGQVGGGVFPELKHSRDVLLTGNPEWQDVDQALNVAVYGGLLQYLRKYPQALIAPLMLQRDLPNGSRGRYSAEELSALDGKTLGGLARTCLRPGAINLQWYKAGEGGYPYWHCELFPRDADAETLHRHLLWTIYLNDGFDDGETEFLFQQRRVKPATGDLLIAPTAFTHTHRGNRPSGGDKFIATSWILFQRAERMFGRT